jgi:hypothetical protein
MSACTTVDNPSSGGGNPQEEAVVAPAQLKQGIWTEYDEALLTSGKYTEEQLAQIPTVGMEIKGDKGYFFTYTADDISEAVEGQINYDNKTGKGTITFPAIKDNPLSDQTVSFSMTTDETMEFEFTYEGQKTTGTCAWLCENLDNWSSDITDEDWKELMAYYEQYDEKAGPDASIDWSDSEVEGLDEPLVWNEDVLAPAGTRAIGIGTVVSMGLKVLGSLFEEDPNEAINAKLDAVLGKLDQALVNQQQMMAKVNELNGRLIAIAQKMKQTETVNILNNRNEKFYNPLKVCNTAYFDAAFKLYNDNKSDLSQVKTQLGNYAKTWVGNNEEYITLTWNYIEYLKTVQHSSYGIGMDRIYDGLTFDKYPWEHLGTGDRLNYRAYDMFMITKCLFMINLYAAYGSGLSDIKKEGIYNNYNSYKPQLKQFCEFTVANPDEFRVCQIPGAHFVMHKEIQKYNFCGADKKSPIVTNYYRNEDVAYFPTWHEKGKIKIENPKELKSKLITTDEADAIFKYYAPNNEKIWWTNMIVNGNTAGGADYAQTPSYDEPCLMLYDPQNRNNVNGLHTGPLISKDRDFGPVMRRPNINWTVRMGRTNYFGERWESYNNIDYYAAIVENRY